MRMLESSALSAYSTTPLAPQPALLCAFSEEISDELHIVSPIQRPAFAGGEHLVAVMRIAYAYSSLLTIS